MKRCFTSGFHSALARRMSAVTVVLWLFLLSPAMGRASDLDSVYLGNVGEGVLWAARGTVRIDDSSDVGFEVVFQSSGEERLAVTVLPSQRVASVLLPTGRITTRSLFDNSQVLTFTRGDGWSCSATFDEKGELIDEDDQKCVERGLRAIIWPAGETLDAVSSFCESRGLIQPAENGLFKGTETKSMLPDWLNCAGNAVGWVASWSTVLACSTGLGCVGAVALITYQGAATADACASWAHDATSGGSGSGDSGTGDSGGSGGGDSTGGSGQ